MCSHNSILLNLGSSATYIHRYANSNEVPDSGYETWCDSSYDCSMFQWTSFDTLSYRWWVSTSGWHSFVLYNSLQLSSDYNAGTGTSEITSWIHGIRDSKNHVLRSEHFQVSLATAGIVALFAVYKLLPWNDPKDSHV